MMPARITRREVLQQAELAGTPALPHRVTAATPRALQRPARVACRGDAVMTYEFVFDAKNATPAPPTLLFDFLALAEASAADIAAFAARFAVLGLCWDHGRPFGHQRRFTLPDLSKGTPNARCEAWFEATKAGRYEERVEDWRRWARRFRLVFDRANALKQTTRSAPLLDEKFLRGYHADSSRAGGTVNNRSSLWDQLARVLTWWLEDAEVVPNVSATGDRLKLDLAATAHYAFPILAVQLFLFVAGARQVATCSACGHPYLPRRQPQKGRDSYCPACGRKAANRAAIRRFRDPERQRVRKTIKGKRSTTHTKRRRTGGTT